MILRFFRKFQTPTLVLLVMVGLILWADVLFLPGAVPFNMARIAALAFLIAQALYLNHIVTSQGLLDRQSYYTAVIYLVLMSSNSDMLELHPVLFANFFLMISLHQVFRTYKEETVLLEVFNVGLLIAIAGFFYQPALLLFLFLIISLFVFYYIDLRSFLAAFLGFATPFILAAVYFFLTDALPERIESFSYWIGTIGLPAPRTTLFTTVLLVFLGVACLLAVSWLVFYHIPDKPIRIRKRFRVLMFYLVVVLLTLFFGHPFKMVHMGLIYLPLSVGLAAYFHHIRSRMVPELMFSLLLLIVLVDKWAGF
jgi:hypothetical protein